MQLSVNVNTLRINFSDYGMRCITVISRLLLKYNFCSFYFIKQLPLNIDPLQVCAFFCRCFFFFFGFVLFFFCFVFSSKFSFLFHLKNHHSKDVNLNFIWNGQAVWIYKADLYTAVAYTLPCKLNHGYHNQAHFHYLQTECFSAVKCPMGYEKNVSFLVIPKSSKVFLKSSKDRTGLL